MSHLVIIWLFFCYLIFGSLSHIPDICLFFTILLVYFLLVCFIYNFPSTVQNQRGDICVCWLVLFCLLVWLVSHLPSLQFCSLHPGSSLLILSCLVLFCFFFVCLMAPCWFFLVLFVCLFSYCSDTHPLRNSTASVLVAPCQRWNICHHMHWEHASWPTWLL